MLLRLLPIATFLISLALLSSIGGAMVVFTEVFPHPWLRDAYLGGKAALEKEVQSLDQYQTDFWFPERTTARGVTLNESERGQAGLTLYTSGHDTSAFLVSMTGEVVHEWHLPFSAVWDETAAVRDPQPDSFVYLIIHLDQPAVIVR